MTQTEIMPDHLEMLPIAVDNIVRKFPDHHVEALPGIGVTIIREALKPDQIASLQVELEDIIEQVEADPDSSEKYKDIGQARYASDLLVGAGFESIGEILSNLGADHGHQAVINRQKPKAKQRFHTDGHGSANVSESNPLFIVQANDNGFIDYLPIGTLMRTELSLEQEAIPIPVNAGDIIIQTNPRLIHRGRNGSSENRYNFVAFNVAPVVSSNPEADLWGVKTT